MDLFHEDQAAWLNQVREPVIDPEREIIDPHHHLWPDMRGDIYNIEDFAADIRSGHNVIGTVFMECGTCYRTNGPEAEKSLGETSYVLAQAARASEIEGGAPILGMVGHVDLRRRDELDGLLDKHVDLAGDIFKGIRHAGSSARDADRESLLIPGPAPADLYRQPDFISSVRRLGERGMSYDTWHYHFQNEDFRLLALACPDTQLVLDHFGTPLGVGVYAQQREAIFGQWCRDIEHLSACENVALKLGGLAMPDNGFEWHQRDLPPSSDEFVDKQGAYYRHAIECFGPERCMFESNFPVDRMSVSYPVLMNAFKKIAADFSADEQDAMFASNARRIYRLG
ncbi:MAG: amidohydrolase family protein [Pseudomonadota bacterium]